MRALDDLQNVISSAVAQALEEQVPVPLIEQALQREIDDLEDAIEDYGRNIE